MKKELADLLFPSLSLTVEEILEKYPKRQLDKSQVVSRFAPSPTGYMHIGNFFQMFISYNLTRMTDGVFFLRVEDTDSKREKKDAKSVVYEILSSFKIHPQEYQTLEGVDVGSYGPYVQSQRLDIYHAFAKKLVEEGKAFPCFCKKTQGKEDVLEQRENKFKNNDEFEYDACRDLTFDQVNQKIKNGEKFALRFKTKNSGNERIKFLDVIKGEIELKANAKDFVILKNDGVPPYAFAHAIDDTLMGTTHVVRGEEYVSSTPSHIELFEALGFEKIKYCHNPLICKLDESGKRRKISKRLDPEADMRFYSQEGYPLESVLEYLLNIINSGFEIWRKNNPDLHYSEFKFGINDITAVAPIFDLVKLADVAKNIIVKMTAQEVYENLANWAKDYDKEFFEYLKNNQGFAIKVCNIDRQNPKPRKDLFKWSMVKEYFSYMFAKPSSFELCEEEKDLHREFVAVYEKQFSMPADKTTWFDNVKQIAKDLGYATDNKEFKANPHLFKGNIAKACEFIRISLTGRKNSPDIFEIMTILGESEVKERLVKII